MSRIRQSGTAPEKTVRRAVTTLGLRYTVNNKDLPGSPDLANRSRRWAIFVHGCYWHRHAGCHKATTPRTNTEFWCNKFEHNVARDDAARAQLQRQGYRVLTFWQCELDTRAKVNGRLARLATQPRR
jgi:DNA mismatch endonuclease (patch repair protein)